ncbi:hypothetical protein VNO78_10658 [Psophocarpus tetragonolobus]|uniref:Uncharacterized protein n=1 Tax=Psophocarpus tetragonolobus TaxID=3891 RepID=A0AAN9XMX9_PSOTE
MVVVVVRVLVVTSHDHYYHLLAPPLRDGSGAHNDNGSDNHSDCNVSVLRFWSERAWVQIPLSTKEVIFFLFSLAGGTNYQVFKSLSALSSTLQLSSRVDSKEIMWVTTIPYSSFLPKPYYYHNFHYQYQRCIKINFPKLTTRASSAAPGVDLNTLESAISKKDSEAVKEALHQLSEVGWAKKWSSQPYVSRRTTSLRELTSLGIKNAENLAIPSVRNDAAFLFTVVGTTGFFAVLAGQLPGDWGFFLPYLIGSISLVVLAVGSISPGLLQAAISSFSSLFPDYQERIARHEAAHFLIAYLLGVPILGYSLDIGKEHVNLIDERLEKLIYSGQLDAKELDRLAVVSMAGLAAEGLTYDKVVGQSADLFTLQRFINRTKPPLSKDQQQNLTRWAVLFAASLLKNNKVIHEALIAEMAKKASVLECIQAIENAA